MLAWVAAANYQEDLEGSARPYRGIAGASSRAEADQMGQLLTDAHAVLRSEQFERNLRGLSAAYPVIYARKGVQDTTANEVADYVSLKKLGARYVVVDAFVVGGQPIEGILASAGEGMPGIGRFADLTLLSIVPRLFQSQDPVERSCAINATAHEYAHTISTMPVRYEAAFTDTNSRQTRISDRAHPGSPIASYLIGAVAQCTWLQDQGRIGPQDLRACIEVFGVNGFNLQRCRSFADGQPVRLRSDLPAVGGGL